MIGGVAAAGTVLLGLGNPNTTHVPLCPLKAITGLDCPFCGSLRAVHSLTHLDIRGALDHNLVFTASVPFLVVGWIMWLRWGLTGHGSKPALPTWVKASIVVGLVTFMVIRNIPAFSWLGSSA